MLFKNVCMWCIFLFFVFFLHVETLFCKRIERCEVTSHYFLAKTFQENIKKYIENFLGERNFKKMSAVALLEEIQKVYPFIDRVRISYRRIMREEVMIVNVSTQRPCALINNSFALTEKGTLVFKEYYCTHVYENCLACIVNDPVLSFLRTNKSKAYIFAQFVKDIPAEITESYDFFWHEVMLICFKHKHMPLTINADLDTCFDGRMLQAINCAQLYGASAYRHAKHDCVRRKNGQLIIDVRCRNRLILAVQKGGVGDENEKVKKYAK